MADKLTLQEIDDDALENNILLRDMILYYIYLDSGGGGGNTPIELNRVAKGTGTSITESQIYDDGVSVGVNIIPPDLDSKLTVVSDTSVSDSYIVKLKNSSQENGLSIRSDGRFLLGDWNVSPTDLATFNLFGKDFTSSEFITNPVLAIGAPDMFRFSPVRDLTKNNNFNNTTDPLVLSLSVADYPDLCANFYANSYIIIDQEILYCTKAYVEVSTNRNFTLTRGAMGTIPQAHANGSEIRIVEPYAISLLRDGRMGFGTNKPDDYMELHIKNSLIGGMSIWRDNEYQDSSGDYGPFKNRPAGPKGVCKFFFCENGCIGISPYNSSGNFTDPQDPIHIGPLADYEGVQTGGIRLDTANSKLFWTRSNPAGAEIRAEGNGSGWIKIFGDNGIFDLSGILGQDFRIGTDGNGTNGKGIYLKSYAQNAPTVLTWKTMLRALNNTAAPATLDLLPDSVGNLTIYGQAAASGTFTSQDGKTITVTHGIITSIV